MSLSYSVNPTSALGALGSRLDPVAPKGSHEIGNKTERALSEDLQYLA